MRWLFVTLINTIIAATVISQFDATIEQIVALAVLMPIVAAMGGNAGMQVVTVTVRALATRDLSPGSNIVRAVGKEVMVNALNAVIFAIIMGVVAGLWFHNRNLGAGAGGGDGLQHGLGGAGRDHHPHRAAPPGDGSGGERRAVPDHDHGRAGVLLVPGAGDAVLAVEVIPLD